MLLRRLPVKRVLHRRVCGQEGERNVIYPPQVARSCVGFLRVVGSVSIAHTRVSERLHPGSADRPSGRSAGNGAASLVEF